MISAPKSQSPYAITQADLEEFQALKHYVAILKRQYEREAARLVQLVEDAAPVEPGRLRVAVQEQFQQRVTKAALVELLDEGGYEQLRSEVRPTVYRRLVVEKQALRRPRTPWGDSR